MPWRLKLVVLVLVLVLVAVSGTTNGTDLFEPLQNQAVIV